MKQLCRLVVLLAALAFEVPDELAAELVPGREPRWDAEQATLPAPFNMPSIPSPVIPHRNWSILQFGAVGDGRQLNTNAIQAAIDACNGAGGGKVTVPAGRWLTGPLELKSNVELHVETGAEIIFTDEKKYYYPDPANPQSQDSAKSGLLQQYYQPAATNAVHPRPMIWASHAQNIAITGAGRIDGQGLSWWPLLRQWWNSMKKYYPLSVYEHAWEGLDPEKTYGRPQLFLAYQCRNLLLEGVTFANSPFWTINPVACENLVVRKVRVRAAGADANPYSPNTDGVNPESCRNVLIEDCDLDTGDDSIAIKSGMDEAGRKRGLPSENIIVRHCQLARVAIGSEMSGGVRNVFIHDCKFSGLLRDSYVHIKTRRGRGGMVENIWVEDIEGGPCSRDILRIDMEYHTSPQGPAPYEPVSERTPRVRNLHFKNIASDHPEQRGTAIFMNGLPEMLIEGISFENIRISSQHGIVCKNARDVTFKNVQLKSQQSPLLMIENSQEISFAGFEVPGNAKPFLILRGKGSSGIRFDPALSTLKEQILLEEEAPGNAVRFLNSP